MLDQRDHVHAAARHAGGSCSPNGAPRRRRSAPARRLGLFPPAFSPGPITARPSTSSIQCGRASVQRWRDWSADYTCRPPPPSGHRARGLSQSRQCGSKAACAHPGATDESSTRMLFPFLLISAHKSTHSIDSRLKRGCAGSAAFLWQDGRSSEFFLRSRTPINAAWRLLDLTYLEATTHSLLRIERALASSA